MKRSIITIIVILALLPCVMAWNRCYQEFADQGGSCGLSSGTYACDGSFEPSSNCSMVYDGDYETLGSCYQFSDNEAILYVNYTIPPGARQDTSFWEARVSDGILNYYPGWLNTTIPIGCWNIDGKLVLRLRSGSTGGFWPTIPTFWSYGECWDGNQWNILLGGSEGGNSGVRSIYEEGMWWTFDGITDTCQDFGYDGGTLRCGRSCNEYVFNDCFTNISSCTELQGITDLAGSYALDQDIDCSDTVNWNGGAGFISIGNGAYFTGKFDGKGHTISNLYINSGNGYAGLFGATSANADIDNVRLTNVNIIGSSYVGGLIGLEQSSSINNVFVSGSITGDNVGGIVGRANGGSISESSANVTIIGNPGTYAGGIIGLAWTGPTVTDSHTDGSITGTGNLGGIIGRSYGTVTRSYSDMNIDGGSSVGGIVGYNWGGIITDSYATGDVNGTGRCGGITGNNGAFSTSGLVTRTYYAGNNLKETSSDAGGITGFTWNYYGAITNDSYWDINKTTWQWKRYWSDWGMGRTTDVMYTQALYSDWDFNSVWTIDEGNDYPKLIPPINSVCGNNIIEGGEVCDGSDLGGQSCSSEGFIGGTIACNPSCSGFDTSRCNMCGNGIIDIGEACDGTNLSGRTCRSQGFQAGTLSCSASCKLVTSACYTTGKPFLDAPGNNGAPVEQPVVPITQPPLEVVPSPVEKLNFGKMFAAWALVFQKLFSTPLEAIADIGKAASNYTAESLVTLGVIGGLIFMVQGNKKKRRRK